MASVYQINKGINKPVEFKGLKAQYVWYLALGLLITFFLFVGLYLADVPLWFLLPFILLLGGTIFYIVYRLSDKYGQYGLMKKMAKRGVPVAMKSNTRSVFKNLSSGSLTGRR